MKIYIFIGLITACPAWIFAQTGTRSQIQKGDRLYDQKQYKKAEEAYQKAGTHPSGAYNTGNAAYKQGNYDAANAQYQRAADGAADPAVKAEAFYNMANAYLQQKKYAEAIAAYEKSLRLQPNRPDAKKNLQIAKKKQNEQPPPPPPPPPKRQPPPPPPPNERYVDQGTPQIREQPGNGMSAEAARELLKNTVELTEQKNARDYRELHLSNRPSRTKKDW